MARGEVVRYRGGTGGGTGAGAGGIPGAIPGGWSPDYGGVPGISNPLDIIIKNMGGLSNFTNAMTSAASNQLRNQYGPEYFKGLALQQANVNRRATGDISDLVPGLQERNAALSLGSGVGFDSDMANSKLARDLGLTKYQVERESLDDTGKIFGATPVVKPFDPTGILQEMMEAQRWADIYRSYPIPHKIPTGGGGGGSYTPFIRYGGGGWASAMSTEQSMRDRMARLGQFGPPASGQGGLAQTRPSGPAPWDYAPGARDANYDPFKGMFEEDFYGPNFGGQDPYYEEDFYGSKFGADPYLTTDYGPTRAIGGMPQFDPYLMDYPAERQYDDYDVWGGAF